MYTILYILCHVAIFIHLIHIRKNFVYLTYYMVSAFFYITTKYNSTIKESIHESVWFVEAHNRFFATIVFGVYRIIKTVTHIYYSWLYGASTPVHTV